MAGLATTESALPTDPLAAYLSVYEALSNINEAPILGTVLNGRTVRDSDDASDDAFDVASDDGAETLSACDARELV